jgi:hypothetical protein
LRWRHLGFFRTNHWIWFKQKMLIGKFSSFQVTLHVNLVAWMQKFDNLHGEATFIQWSNVS